MSPSLSLRRCAPLALALSLLAACGDDDDDASGTAGSAGSAGAASAGSSGTSGQSGAGAGGSGAGGSGAGGAGAGQAGAGAAGAGAAGAGAAGAGQAGGGAAGAGGDAGAAGEASQGGQAGQAGAGQGGAGQGGVAGASGAAVTFAPDVTLPRTGGGTWPHKIDVYGPSNAVRALVMLHGGGGNKEQVAKNLHLVQDGTIDEAWLIAHQVLVVMPQGQFVPPDGVPTWTNGVMISGQDDQAFLVDLAAALRSGALAGQPAVGRVYVAGHSNGGMMSNWMWCQSSTTFDAYGALAGPAAHRFDPVLGTAACTPASPRPYLGLVGSEDIVLRTKGNWAEPTWTITPALTKKTISWDDPDLVNEERFHTLVRTPALCQAAPSKPVDSSDGATTTWSDCGGKVRLVRVNGADHDLVSLQQISGLELKDELLAFFVASEP